MHALAGERVKNATSRVLLCESEDGVVVVVVRDVKKILSIK